ncbi:uncharacterized protein Tco_1318842 [Tanacetum coccineum]
MAYRYPRNVENADLEIESEILRPFEQMDVDTFINPDDADVEDEFEDTTIGVTQSNTSILTPIHVDLNKGTNASVDPAILKKREYQKSYYQRRKQKKIAEANANMEPQTPLGATQNLSALTCAPTHLNLSPNRVPFGTLHNKENITPLQTPRYYASTSVGTNESEFEHKLKWPNLDRDIVTILSRVLAPNPYVQTFRSLGNLGPLDKYRVKLTTSFKDDQRLYNRPTMSEVASIWVEGNENITTYKRSIVVYGRSEYPTQIQAYFACYDPLSYLMFFPNGEAGWHKRIPREGVDVRELIDDDDDDGVEDEEGINTTKGRKTRAIVSEIVVDTYIKIETSRLKFCEKYQSTVRADLGPRDMRKRFLDAMTFVQDAGKPDTFLTMTCNPNWLEIVENLYEGQTAQDRPRLVTRDFYAKLEYLKHQLFTKHILGVVASHIYVIKFQKQGLPHPHFLLIMKSAHKLANPDHYDKVCPCMEGEPKKCHWNYPRQFQETTRQGDDLYPLYRQRDNGIEVNVRNSILDNRWVVPYNPTLLMMFNCHINVEVCSSIKSVKYVFKYVYKGHDKQVVKVDKDGDQVVNEIKRFQDVCYVSPPEAMWRIYGFPLSNIYPSVMSLQVHLPNNRLVSFREDDVLTDILNRERNKRSMLTAFFELNKTDPNARQYLYRDIPRRAILSRNGFDYLYTVDDVLYTTFRRVALERGLIKSDNHIHACLREASTHELPYALRRLFATLLIFCEPGDVRKLWDDHYESLSEDYNLNCASVERVQNMVLTDISAILQSMGRSLSDFDLPNITADVRPYAFGCREVHEECSIVVLEEDILARHSLNTDQKNAYDTIMRHVDADSPGVFFIDGPGGTGKTFLYKALLANVRSRGLIALATASSGAAANNMTGGRTAHSRFKIPINLTTNSMCNIKKQSGLAKLLCQAKLIIWDEASMAKRQAVEAVLPVVRRGTRAQIVDSSLRMSPLWSIIKRMRLTINMRARTDPWFSSFLLRVGDGVEEVIDEYYVRIPDDMTIPYTNDAASKNALINEIFPSFATNASSSSDIVSRAILSTKNEHVDSINNELIDRFHGEENFYYSFDEAEDDIHNFYPLEFLNSLNVTGLPPYCLRLKVGCPIILLRNLDPANGLCNGTRLICKRFDPNVINAEIAAGQHAGVRVLLPRILLAPSEEDMFPFKLKRTQFPIRLSFAMTINKAQGQTIPNVGVYLPESVFSHGQLYVALSRGISRTTTKVLVKPEKEVDRPGVYTSNVVYQEVLHDD